MKKIILVSLILLANILTVTTVTAAVAQKAPTIKIGINAEMTGEIPKVGEATKFAAQMWVNDVNHAGGFWKESREVDGEYWNLYGVRKDLIPI